MNYVLPPLAKRILKKVGDSYGKWRKTPKYNHVFLQDFLLVTISVVCGLLFAYASGLFLPEVTKQSLLSTNNKNVTLPGQSKDFLSEQNNPLFSKQPAWVQDFTAQTTEIPDPQYWNVLVGPAQNDNKEQQYYTASVNNLRIENGALRIIATKSSQPGGYSYSSARLETEGKKSFLYGRIDVMAKMPKGTGTWPAVWMMPANDLYARKSPNDNVLRYRNGGEIDIIEAVGFEPGIIYGVAHTLLSAESNDDGSGNHGTVSVPTSAETFNKYSLMWTPTSLVYAVNNEPYFVYNRSDKADYTVWPFDQPFYLIVNLAMGGTWGGNDTANFPGNGIDDEALPTSLDIQSIHYYPYIGPSLSK